MSHIWHLQLFGGLRARCGDRIISRFPTYQTGALLARLAYFPRRHHRDELSDLLWPDADLDIGRTRLRTTLASLRRQLEPPRGADVIAGAGTVVLADRDHVGLRPGAVVVDAVEFATALRRADAAPPGPERDALLAAAFALYEGELLSGYDEDWVVGERERLARLYGATVGRLVAAREEAGDAGGALQAARRAVEVDPLLESAHAEVIRLLIAQGEPQAARQQFEALAQRLRDELDAAPAPATQALLAGPADAPPARAVPTAPAPARPTAPAAAAAPPPFPRPPQPLTRFFGRAEELARLSDWLSDPAMRLVTVTGPGGTGKTRLALEFALRAAGPWGGTVAFVAASSLSEAARLREALADALGLPSRGDIEPLAQVRAALEGRPALLLLDNLEHLAEAAAPDIEGLLTSLPQLRCLITSRQRLDIPGERELFLPTLPVPPSGAATGLTPAALAGFAGVQLFVDRAQSARPDFALTPRNARAVAALCARLEGVPLALELAAAWARMLSPAQMQARLDDKIPLLVSRRPDVPTRHSSLWAAIDGSFQSLSAPLKRLFVRLSVFRGGWTEEAAETVCEEPLALEALDQLRARSLLTTREDGETLRYGMLETLREFCEERMTPAEGAALSRRHAEHFRDVAELAEAGLDGSGQIAWLDRLEAEHDNLRAALSWATAHDRRLAEGLSGSLWRFWLIRGYIREGREWYTRILAQPSGEPTKSRLRALIGWANLDAQVGELRTARAVLEECLPICEYLQEREGMASVLDGLAGVLDDLGDYDAARAYGEQSLALYRDLDSRQSVTISLNNLGYLTRHAGDYAASLRYLQESLEFARQDGNLLVLASALGNLALTLLMNEELERAQACFGEALDIQRRLNDRQGTASSLGGLGTVEIRRGDYASARVHLRDCLLIREEIGEQMKIMLSLSQVARLALATGQPRQAAVLLGAEEALRESYRTPRSPSDAADYRRVQDELSAALDEKRRQSAWMEGRAMDWRQAVQTALTQVLTEED